MADINVPGNAISSNVSESPVQSAPVSDVPRGTPEPSVQVPEPEKMLPQSKVNELIGRTRQEERERAMREAESKYKPSNQQVPQSMGGVQQLSEERIRQLYSEEAQKQAINAVNQRVGQDFLSKLDKAKAKYEDFDKVTEDLQIMSLPMNYVSLFNEMDNVGDILYDLGKNPEKLGQLVPLFYDEKLARKALKKMSDAFKINEIAASQPKANTPLSKILSSPTGIDNGKMTIQDKRNNPKFRA